MTPQEKAFELIAKMEKDFQYFASREIAIQHALIAVEFSKEFITGDLNEAFDKFLYIQDIKEEIEKL